MQCPPPSPAPGFARLMFLAAALGLLTMPVEYRGGAKDAHSHGILQFWVEAGHGSLDHHHRDGSPHHEVGEVRERAADVTGQSTSDEVEIPRLSDAATAQWFVPMALAFATAMFLPVLSTRAQPFRIQIERPTGRNPAPTPPPPRFALFA